MDSDWLPAVAIAPYTAAAMLVSVGTARDRDNGSLQARAGRLARLPHAGDLCGRLDQSHLKHEIRGIDQLGARESLVQLEIAPGVQCAGAEGLRGSELQTDAHQARGDCRDEACQGRAVTTLSSRSTRSCRPESYSTAGR